MKNQDKKNTCPQCERVMPSTDRCPACFFWDELTPEFDKKYFKN